MQDDSANNAVSHKTARTRRSGGRSFLLALTITTATISVPTVADRAFAQASGAAAKTRFDIRPQPLAQALIQFSNATGVQLFFNADLARGVSSKGAQGALTRKEALGRILAGSGLTYKFTNASTVAIQKPEAAVPAGPAVEGAINLDTINVQGAEESAYGPVVGYRATRTGTATWTDTPIRDVPQSIQVVPRQILEDQQDSSLVSALQNVSNVSQLSENGGRADTFTIRGFDQRNYKINGLTVNQALITDETNIDPAWIERAEVLKGPSAVLYGDGGYGGTVNIVTRSPSLTPGAEASFGYGSYGRTRADFSVTGPVAGLDDLAFRLTGAAQGVGSWRDMVSDSKRQFIAPSLLWTPSADTKVWIDAAYTRQTAPIDFGLIGVDGKPIKPYTRYLNETWAKQTGHKSMVDYGVEHRVNDWLQIRARGNFSEGEAHRLRAPAVKVVGDLLTHRAADQYDASHSGNFVLDSVLDFDTGPFKHHVVMGGEYQNGWRSVTLYQAKLASIDIYDPVYGALPGPFSLSSITKSRVVTKSLFFQDQIDLTSQIKLLGGVRYEDEKVSNDTTGVRSGYGATRATPRLGLVYQPLDWLSLYASYSEGYQAQGGTDESGRAFTPETGRQYEVGAKFDIIPDRLSATLSAFRIVRQGVLTTPADSDYSIQTGQQRSQGVELDVNGEILPNWNVMASVGYDDAQITKDELFPVGNSLANTPRWGGSLWSTYMFEDGPLTGFGFGGGFVARGKRYADLYNTVTLPGYVRFDATAFYNINEHFKATLTVKNLFNTQYIFSAQNNNEIYPGDPFTVMLGISAKL